MVAESAPEVLWRLRPVLAVAEHPKLVQPWRQDFVHVPIQLSKEALAQLHARSIQTLSMPSPRAAVRAQRYPSSDTQWRQNVSILPTCALSVHLDAQS